MKWTDNRSDTLRDVWLSGWTDPQIAGHLHTSRGAIQRQCRRLGLPPRVDAPEIQAVRPTGRYVGFEP